MYRLYVSTTISTVTTSTIGDHIPIPYPSSHIHHFHRRSRWRQSRGLGCGQNASKRCPGANGPLDPTHLSAGSGCSGSVDRAGRAEKLVRTGAEGPGTCDTHDALVTAPFPTWQVDRSELRDGGTSEEFSNLNSIHAIQPAEFPDATDADNQ